MHEFDRQRFPDRYKGMSLPGHGELVVDSMRFYMKRNGIVFPETPKYLALGAGLARAELQIAESLGIPFSEVRLLDRDPVIRNHALWEHPFPPENYLETGIFTYLQDPTEKNFSLVTALNVEYAFAKEYALPSEETVDFFVVGIDNILQPQGIVHVTPNRDYRRFQRIWELRNFRRINENEYSDSLSDHLYVKES